MTANSITRDFTVNPALVGMAAINATGCKQYVTERVAQAMPRATDESGQIHFFRVDMILEVGQPALEAAKRGLVIADPHTLAAFNAANPEFAGTHPNVTVWDKNGYACYATFTGRGSKRFVSVRQGGYHLGGSWWFAGVRKSA
jgi:hypothetical protein